MPSVGVQRLGEAIYLASGYGIRSDVPDGDVQDAAINDLVERIQDEGGGTLQLPHGTIPFADRITRKAKVIIAGAGTSQNAGDAATRLKCVAPGAGIDYEDDGPGLQDLMVDGNNVGTSLFRALTSNSDGYLRNVVFRYSAQDGMTLHSVQNMKWDNVLSLTSARHGLVLDDGTGGHNIDNSDFSNSSGNNILIDETVDHGGYPYPTNIVFNNSRAERALGATYACIQHNAGEFIVFRDGLMGHRNAAWGGGVFAQKAGGAIGVFTIDGTLITGLSTNLTIRAIDADAFAAHPLMLRGRIYVNAIKYALFNPASRYVDVSQVSWDLGAGTSLLDPATNTAGLIGLNPPGCLAYGLTAGVQSIPNNVLTALSFQATSYDTNAFHSSFVNPSRLTVPSDGTYMISATGRWAENAVGTRQMSIFIGGTAVGFGIATDIKSPSGASGSCAHSIGIPLQMSAGSYVEIYVYQNSGGALNMIHQNQNGCYFSIARIGAT